MHNESGRICAPEVTLEKILPFLDHAGVTRVANITGLDYVGIPVYMVTRPEARSISVSQGKGYDKVSAKVSGIMEAMETYLAEHHSIDLRFSTENELSKVELVADCKILPKTSDIYNAMTPMLWGRAVETSSHENIYVPYDLCHTDYRQNLEDVSGYFQCSSNGLASGNTWIEAVLHGAYEVIERDCNTLFNHLSEREFQMLKVSESSITDEICLEIVRKLMASDITFGIWNMTSDVGVPCFYCVIRSDDDQQSHTGAGAGCHLDSGIALRRALTEAVQVRLTMIASVRDDIDTKEYKLEFKSTKNCIAANLIDMDENPCDYASIKSYGLRTLEDQFLVVKARLARLGIDSIYAVNLTNNILPIFAAKTIIPKLEGISEYPNYIPGDRVKSATSHMSGLR